jgi:hypothetical protein
MTKHLLAFTLVQVMTISLAAQQVQPVQSIATSASQPALNNDDISKLVKAGPSDELIVSTVNSQPGSYDTSVDGLSHSKPQALATR